MYSETFPSRLKETRKSFGITQGEVAKELNINRVSLTNYENGKAKPDIRTLASLADYYGVSTDFLIGNGMHEFHGFEPESNFDGARIWAKDFPARLKHAREIKGQSQAKAAKALKISQSSLAKYELGQLEPNLETLAKLTLYYRMRADWLLGLTDIKQKNNPVG